jgi:transcriptional regulator with XRE-family HTH domain
MTAATITQTSAGSAARKLRISMQVSQQELASMAGVPEEAVELFERDLPVTLDSRRRIHRALWAKKVGK